MIVRSTLLLLLALASSGLSAGHATAQTARGAAAADATAALLPSDVSLILRVDAAALARSPLLPRLLEHPEAEHPLARALARPKVLERLWTAYIGLPASFTPESRDIPVVIAGSFTDEDIVRELSSAAGVKRTQSGGRTLLVADAENATSYAMALGQGILALGGEGSLKRMAEVRDGKLEGISASLWEALGSEGGSRHVVAAGRVPDGLRSYLRTMRGGLAAPFAHVERVALEGSLGRTIDVRGTLFTSTTEGTQAVQQALGAVQVFGPSRFANDPEVLSAIQSLHFTVGARRVDLSFTLPRSLLLEML